MRYDSSRAKCFQHFSTYCVCVCILRCISYAQLSISIRNSKCCFIPKRISQSMWEQIWRILAERASERTKERNSWAMASWNDLALSGIGEVSHHHQSQYNEKTTANTRNKKLAQQYRLCAHEWDTYQLPFNVHENAKTTATAAAAAEANNFSNVTNRVD